MYLDFTLLKPFKTLKCILFSTASVHILVYTVQITIRKKYLKAMIKSEICEKRDL